MEKDIAEDLISYKKRNIQEQINQILKDGMKPRHWLF